MASALQFFVCFIVFRVTCSKLVHFSIRYLELAQSAHDSSISLLCSIFFFFQWASCWLSPHSMDSPTFHFKINQLYCHQMNCLFLKCNANLILSESVKLFKKGDNLFLQLDYFTHCLRHFDLFRCLQHYKLVILRVFF